MVKVVTLFLIFIMVMAMLGRLRMPKLPGPFRRKSLKAGEKCAKCGRYSVSGEPCKCET